MSGKEVNVSERFSIAAKQKDVMNRKWKSAGYKANVTILKAFVIVSGCLLQRFERALLHRGRRRRELCEYLPAQDAFLHEDSADVSWRYCQPTLPQERPCSYSANRGRTPRASAFVSARRCLKGLEAFEKKMEKLGSLAVYATKRGASSMAPSPASCVSPRRAAQRTCW